MSDSKKAKDAEDILSEFDSRTKPPQEPTPEPEVAPEPEAAPEAAPEPEPAPELSSETSDSPQIIEDRDTIFVGTKPIMNYVSATLTQLSTRHTVTIKARGKRITQAVDISQMIVKRMDLVGYVISDVRISSSSLTSQDGKQRNVSTMEIDLSKN